MRQYLKAIATVASLQAQRQHLKTVVGYHGASDFPVAAVQRALDDAKTKVSLARSHMLASEFDLGLTGTPPRLKLRTGITFEQAIYSIAFLEQKLQEASAKASPHADTIHDNRIRSLLLCDNELANAHLALEEARREIPCTPPKTNDRLINTYYRWMLANLEFERLQAAPHGNTAADILVEATRVRAEALAALVAAVQ